MKKRIALLFLGLSLSIGACKDAIETSLVMGHIDEYMTGYVSIINISNAANKVEILDSSKIVDHRFELNLGPVKGIVPVSILFQDEKKESSIGGLFLASNGQSRCDVENGQLKFSGNAVQDTFTTIVNTFTELAMKFQVYAKSDLDSFKIVTNDFHLMIVDLLERHGDSEFNQFAYSIATNYLSFKFGDSYYNKFLIYCTDSIDINENVWRYNFCRQLDMQTNLEAGRSLDPSFSLLDKNGNTVSLGDFSDKIVLLDFWAYWCAPCLKDIPKLKKLYEKYAPLGLEIISISTDLKENLWLKSIEKNNAPWIQLMDSGNQEKSLSQKLNVGPIPRYILLDRSHKIARFDVMSENLDRQISELLR